MELRRGVAVSPGVAIGPAVVLGAEGYRIPKRFVKANAVDQELSRYRLAINDVCVEIGESEKLISERLGKQYGAIFAAHIALARDPKLTREIEELIGQKNYSAEFAVSRTFRSYAKTIQNLGDRYFAERASDLFDLEKRILRQLLDVRREELTQLTSPVIVLAHNLSPGETANLDTRYVLGFATEVGGKSSHTAILAGALELPAVVGMGDFLEEVEGGETVIIDGNHGVLILNPDEETLREYRESEKRFKSVSVRLAEMGSLEPVTRDGVRINIHGNIEFPEETVHCLERGADGIGLYRTEFLYLGNDKVPTEEVHYDAYTRVLKSFPDKPVVIRTLDLGAEKIPGSMQEEFGDVPNPALGLRSIRLSLMQNELFRPQLRAILRAAVHGDIRVMFPLVSTQFECRHARLLLGDVKEELEEEGIPFRGDIPVGMMVEVPSAAILADEFAQMVDFFSIGTNDLIQYTLAVDRANPAVANLYSAADPAILRILKTVLKAAQGANIPASICGQMGSDPIFMPLLVGMGYRDVSVTPHSIPELKQVVRSLTIPVCEEIVRHVQTLDVARDIENYLRGQVKKICPELEI
jgi:phosphoenolpyruvate-protein phosphotransferase (PTS system enzyme I)